MYSLATSLFTIYDAVPRHCYRSVAKQKPLLLPIGNNDVITHRDNRMFVPGSCFTAQATFDGARFKHLFDISTLWSTAGRRSIFKDIKERQEKTYLYSHPARRVLQDFLYVKSVDCQCILQLAAEEPH